MVFRMFICCWATYASEMLRWSIPTVFFLGVNMCYAINPMVNEVPTIELCYQTRMNKMLNWIIYWGSFGLRFKVDSVVGNEFLPLCISLLQHKDMQATPCFLKDLLPWSWFHDFWGLKLVFLQTFLLEKAHKCECMVSFDFHILLLHITYRPSPHLSSSCLLLTQQLVFAKKLHLELVDAFLIMGGCFQYSTLVIVY